MTIAFHYLKARIRARPIAVPFDDNLLLTKTIFGHKMLLSKYDYSLAPHILLDGYWERWVTNFILNLVEPSFFVVEVGANYGYYTLLFAESVGPTGAVLAFEAHPLCFRTLFKNIEINGFSSRVVLQNNAVTNVVGTTTLHYLTRHHGDSSVIELKQSSHQLDHTNSVVVTCTTLDEYFEANNIARRIDLLKIDAEGSEGLILQGMNRVLTSNPPRHIILEFIPDRVRSTGVDPAQILNRLSVSGYELFYINEKGRPVEVLASEILRRKHSYTDFYLRWRDE